MKSQPYSKIQEILATRPEDAKLLKEAGLIDQKTLDEITAHAVTAQEPAIDPNPPTEKISAQKYYDPPQVKAEILDEISGYQLQELEFEPGKYEYAYDYLGDLETACRYLGLKELGIEETDDGYKLGDQQASSIEELEAAPQALAAYADRVALDLTEQAGLPGAFFFAFNPTWGANAFRLFYAFERTDIQELEKLGADIQGVESLASFDQILAALEDEGCHELALRLHAALREI